jgi:hypothetical protein
LVGVRYLEAQRFRMAFIPFIKAMYIHHGVNLGGVRLGDSRHSASTTGLTLEAVMFKIRQEM